MLTPDQIAALRDAAGRIADPINDFLLSDIARRISKAGQLTSTASYQVWRAQQLGMSQREIKQELKMLLRKSNAEIERLLTQSAEVGYRFDLSNLPTSAAVPFESNPVVQQMVSAAVKLAQDDFTNLTQTLGLTDPYGKALPLQEAYRKMTDYAFQRVFTGASDYNTAIRQATKNLADLGVRVIDYESGIHTSLEAAVRRNIMGGLGLLQEQITQYNHDTLGADGWEISAHANSAPDHEPIQGKQYSDAEYIALNNSLLRRIGTLNCGHVAFPIIMGVSEPQYTEEQLRKLSEDNAAGVTVDGKHYTGYEATQMQRKLERAIRKQKRRVLVDEASGDAERLQTDQIRYVRLREEYSRFSKAAGLRTQQERVRVGGFGAGQAKRAMAGYKSIAMRANSMYDIGSEDKNIDAYMRDLPLRAEIQSGAVPLNILPGQQRKHILGTLEYNQYVKKLENLGQYGPSRLSITQDDAQELVDRYCGTGILEKRKDGVWNGIEEITVHIESVGTPVNNLTGAEADTAVFKIHYGKNGTHIVPGYPSRKGAKAIK